jgi:hypothetical protein
LKEPLVQLEGEDYSHFEKFYWETTEAPAHLKDPTKPFKAFSANRVLKDHLRFRTSERHCGLQLADIVASGIRRACNGTLQIAGWRNLGKLMVQNEVGHHTLECMALGPGPRKHTVPYAGIVKIFDRDAKQMLTPDKFR